VPNTGSSAAAWTEAYGYDGFGNLTSKSLNGAPGAIDVDPTNNKLQVASIRYDADGNLLAGPGGLAMTYDVRNRLASAQPGGTGNALEYYGYAPDNKRLLRVKSNGTEEWTLYGARGEKLGVYALSGPNATYDYTGNWAGQSASFVATSTNIWFDGRLVAEGVTWSLPGGNPVFQDRLGTNRASGARFRPYGDEISATANDRVKFGTYTRDGFTGLDYADQRFYASSYGRFNTADPYRASAGASEPGSWNRYAYVGGDPVNHTDRHGLQIDDGEPGQFCWDSDGGESIGSYTTCFGNNDTRKGVQSSPFDHARAALIHAGGMLLARQSISAKCQGAMEALKVDFDILAVSASTVDIQNGMKDGGSIAGAYGDPSLGASAQRYYDSQFGDYLKARGLEHLTIGDYFKASGTTAAWTPVGGLTVYVNTGLLNTSSMSQNQGLMLHEMLHQTYGQVDTDIMKTLATYDPGANINPAGASRQISDWLTANCVDGKGNN
jgi:RHS repeat-associated protein